MRLAERAVLGLLHRLEPERAHHLSLLALRAGLGPNSPARANPRLKTRIAGLDLANPIGLAAGYDKNAQAIGPLLGAGFGFVEIGAATPVAQPGNPRPRLFRLPEDRAAINRFGFNNVGADVIASRLARRTDDGIVGVNLGANKDSADRAADYVRVLKTCAAHADFVTVNVSSPNTARLRDLQGAAALAGLLTKVMAARDAVRPGLPVFLKIAPDLEDALLNDIADLALEHHLDAIIATNTTLARDGLQSVLKSEVGGLSGAPLFAPSTRILALLAKRLRGRVPLIGVGGVGSPETAYAKIKAGASAVQLYTAMVYQGIGIVGEIARGVDTLLERDGFDSVSLAVGTDIEAYAS